MKTVTFDPATHKVVPIEPTELMVNDGEVFASSAALCYRDVITAAPEYQGDVWIKCSERLPLEHASVLVSFLDQYQYPQIANGYYFKLSNGDLIWHQNADFCEAQGGWDGAIISPEKLNITHWMPLPPAPEKE